jgi:hypothetical protein
VDTTGALESIAKMLPGLPPEAVESLLVTFDSLVGVLDADSLPIAVQLLRDTAALCDEARRMRLLAAAAAVESGEPCATTPDGLTWKQAAAAQTVTMEQWQAMPHELPAENPPEPDDPPEIMEREPPKLPRLRVRHFFPGLVFRVRQEIRDVRDRVVVPGQLLHLWRLELSDADGGETTLHLTERNLRLDASTPHYAAILENNGNKWFQPVPTASCLEDLCEAIYIRMTEFDDARSEDEDENDEDEDEGDEGDDEEDDEEDDDEDDGYSDRDLVRTIREDLESCQDWLSHSPKRGHAPRCQSGPLAAELFERNHEHALAAWVPLLFAGMEYCILDPPEKPPSG